MAWYQDASALAQRRQYEYQACGKEASWSDFVCVGPSGTMVVEFRGRVSQRGGSGEAFTGVGFLYRVAGLSDKDLFAGSPQSVATAFPGLVLGV